MFSLEINATSLFFFLFNKMIRSLTRIYTFSPIHTFEKFIITAAHSKEKCQRVIWNCDCSVNIRPIGDGQATFVVNGHRLKEFSLSIDFFLKDADILFGEAQDVFKRKGKSFCYYSYFQPLIIFTKDCVNLN